MKRERRNHSPEFKARIALEAVRGLKTTQQIAAENGVHPVQVTQWKKEMTQGAAMLFERSNKAKAAEKDQEADKARLERKVGQLVVEVDWLQKKCRELGIDP